MRTLEAVIGQHLGIAFRAQRIELARRAAAGIDRALFVARLDGLGIALGLHLGRQVLDLRLQGLELLLLAGYLLTTVLDRLHALRTAFVGLLESRAVLLGQAHDSPRHLARVQVQALLGRHQDGDVHLVEHPLPADQLVGRQDPVGGGVRVVEPDGHALAIAQLIDRADVGGPALLEWLGDLQRNGFHLVAGAVHDPLELFHLDLELGADHHHGVERLDAVGIFHDVGDGAGIQQQVGIIGPAQAVNQACQVGLDRHRGAVPGNGAHVVLAIEGQRRSAEGDGVVAVFQPPAKLAQGGADDRAQSLPATLVATQIGLARGVLIGEAQHHLMLVEAAGTAVLVHHEHARRFRHRPDEHVYRIAVGPARTGDVAIVGLHHHRPGLAILLADTVLALGRLDGDRQPMELEAPLAVVAGLELGGGWVRAGAMAQCPGMGAALDCRVEVFHAAIMAGRLASACASFPERQAKKTASLAVFQTAMAGGMPYQLSNAYSFSLRSGPARGPRGSSSAPCAAAAMSIAR